MQMLLDFMKKIQLSLYPKRAVVLLSDVLATLRKDPWLHEMIGHLRNWGDTKQGKRHLKHK